MNNATQIIGVLIGLAVVLEFLVDGVKELLPDKLVLGKEKIVAFVVSLIVCLILPYIKVYQVALLQSLNVVERIVLAFFVFRGSQVLYDVMKKHNIGM